MVQEILLNNTLIKVNKFKNEKVNGLHKISFNFKVSSEEYYEITTLLYRGTFQVSVLEQNLTFKGTIQQYSSSITNLYEKGQTGDFHLSLIEVKQ
ncbi:DUF3219 family protein [Alteribacillus sp. JSM 102045]|uniref:DUF3219 family protein n=1 Tax=Alteribacillus sp. JSM 102045 TaxID=1562101 RepID=UPI0035C062BA